MASSKSSASSLSLSISALRVTRNGSTFRISMPGKSSSKLCSIMSCSGIHRRVPGTRYRRDGISGTFTRANSCSLSPGRCNITPRLTLMLEMNGNRWPGSTASGVRMGNTLWRNHFRASFCSSIFSSSHFSSSISCARNAGYKSVFSMFACAFAMIMTRSRMPANCCAGVSASTTGPVSPASIWWRSEPTRFMKNSSKLLEKMHKKRTRSNNGTPASPDISRTRRLNSSHSKSRLRNRAGSVSGAIAAELAALAPASAATGSR